MKKVLLYLTLLGIGLSSFGITQQFPKDFRTGEKYRQLPPIPPAPTGQAFQIPEAPFSLPSMEELQKLEWNEGWLAGVRELAAKRAKEEQFQTDKTVEWALSQKNNPKKDKQTNKDILAALCHPPKSDEEVDWDATLRSRIVSPSSLSFLLASSTYEFRIVRAIAATPFDFDHNFIPLADNAYVKSWKRHKGGLYDMLTLRDDLTWEDGTPWTAYDIEFSYHLIMKKPEIDIPAARSGTDELKWVKAYDARTIVFFHSEALATNHWNINYPVMPKHIFEKSIMADHTMVDSDWHAYWNRYPLASGPYKVLEFATGSHILVERREDWYMKGSKQIRFKPYFKYIRYKIVDSDEVALIELKRGNIDEMRLDPDQFVRQTAGDDFYKHNTKLFGPSWTYMYVCWQTKGEPTNPFFGDLRVRKAMSHAFDMKRWLEDINHGLYIQGAGPFHPQSPWGTPDLELIEYDPEEAAILLEDAGWYEDENGNGILDKKINGELVDFEFTFLCPNVGTAGDCAVILKENLKNIGVEMNIRKIEWATYAQMTKEHKFQASCAAWGTGADPDTAKNIWKTEMYKQGRNYGGYSNEEVDELFEEGKKEFDFEKRREIYQEINRLIYEDQPYTFLNHRAELWAWNKELRGYNFSPRDPFGYCMGFLSIWKTKKK